VEINKKIPDHIFQTYFKIVNKEIYPNIVQTRNITIEGLISLTAKNNLVWVSSFYDNGLVYLEGLVKWGKSQVFVYFKKIDKENVYNIFIITEDMGKIDMLLVALNKFKTIDNI
jgi:hypothetical protein